MEKKNVLYVLAVSLIICGLAGAQSNESKKSVFKPEASGFIQKPTGFLNALLDPSRFSMSHSYSISLFSAGRQTFSQGLYLNTMNYKFADPLTMQVRVGFLHQPLGGGLGMTNGQNGKLFLQRAMVQYKPSEKMSITFDYQVYPYSMASPYYRYRGRTLR